MTKTDPSEIDLTSEMTDETRLIINKAKRSYGVSMSILLLGVMAIVLALVYRVVTSPKPEVVPAELTAIILPVGADVISIVPSGDVIAVTYSFEGQTALRMISADTGEILKDIPVVGVQ